MAEPARPQDEIPPRRIVFAVNGDPRDPRTQSGVATHLGNALDRVPGIAVERVDTSMPEPFRWLAALLNVRSTRNAWRSAIHSSPLSTRLRTRMLARRGAIRGCETMPVLQLRSMYLPLKTPYVPYVDSTVQITRDLWPQLAPRGRRLPKVLGYERAFLRGAAHVFVTGRLVAESLVSFYGVERQNVTVVGAGSHYRPAAGSATRAPWILFVGRDFERKGGDRLVRAFRDVRRRLPEARLKIVGPPHLKVSEPGVDIVGPVHDRRELARLYGQARVFALPVRHEPYGIAFLEAMAHGLPCLGTEEGAIPEIIEHGTTGYVTSSGDIEALADSLTALLTNPEQAATMGDAGRRRVRDVLNWDAVATRMVPVLSSLT